MKPEVSVIMPAYNVEDYIAKAIESVLVQTLSNIELIVVDDDSRDSTVKVVRNFTDKRIKLLVNEKNLGASGARNRALKVAQGKWVAVLDADDWYAPERLEKLLEVADSENADMVADDLYLIQDGEDSPWSTLINESSENIKQIKEIPPVYFVQTDVYGKRGLHLGISKPIFKRDFLLENDIKYDEKLTVVQDFWLDMKCLVSGAKFLLLPQPYYYYRARSGSLVYSNEKKNLEQSCQKIVDFIAEEDIVNNNPCLARALSRNLDVLKKNLAYQRVVDAIKQKKWSRAVTEMVRNYYFFVHLIFQIPGIIHRRIQYYLLGNKSAFKLFQR